MEETLERMHDQISRQYVEAVARLGDPALGATEQKVALRQAIDHLRLDLERVELALRLVRGGNVLPE